MLEANIDDTHAEFLGSDFQEKLMAIGAKDFYWTSVLMKKGRPALKLSVLTIEDKLEIVSNYLLEHTSTIGLRYYSVERHELSRRIYTLETSYGDVVVKEVITPSGQKRSKIEYESLWKLSQESGISIQQLQASLYKEL